MWQRSENQELLRRHELTHSTRFTPRGLSYHTSRHHVLLRIRLSRFVVIPFVGRYPRNEPPTPSSLIRCSHGLFPRCEQDPLRGPHLDQPTRLPPLQPRRDGRRQVNARPPAVCRLLLAHLSWPGRRSLWS